MKTRPFPASGPSTSHLFWANTTGMELFRLYKTELTPHSDLTAGTQTILSIRSDGTVLFKLAMEFRPDSLNPTGFSHSYGWKKAIRVHKSATPEQLRDAYVRAGYTSEC